MATVSKKTTKTRRPKALKKPSPMVESVWEAPVLFRLPDLTEVHFVTAEPAIQYLSEVAESHTPSGTELSAKLGGKPGGKLSTESDTALVSHAPGSEETAKRPSVWKRTAHATQYVLLAGRNQLAPSLARIAKVPYIAPAGLLGVSLIATLVLIYLPWGGASATSPVESQEVTSTPLPAARSTLIDSTPPGAAAKTEIAATPKRTQRKSADDLDQQLAEAESPDTEVADTRRTDDGVADAISDNDDSFTEPWWRSRPVGHRTTAQVAADETESSEVEADEDPVAMSGDDDGDDVGDDESELEGQTAALRTARQTRPSRQTMRDADEEPIESELPRSRYADRQRERALDQADAEERMPSNPRTEENASIEDEAESPWRRIRKQRREPEQTFEDLGSTLEAPPRSARPNSDEEIAARGVKPQSTAQKPKYRSPPGQEIELSEDWGAETASRPRNDLKRNGVR